MNDILSFNSAFEAQDESLKVDRKASHFYFTVFFKTSCWLWNEPLDKFLPAMKHVAWVFGWFEKARFLKFLLVGFTVEVCGSGKKNSIRAQARGQGGAMEAIAPPPIPKVAPKIFRVIKLLMCKPRKHFNASQRNCLRHLFHQLLVEPDQNTMVHQLSMITQTLCTRASESFIQWEAKQTIQLTSCKRFDNNCYHLQCIAIAILLCTEDDNSCYRNVCKMSVVSFALAVVFIIRLFSTSAFRVPMRGNCKFFQVN